MAFDSAAATLGPVVWATEIDPTTSAPRTPVESFVTETPTLYATVAVERVHAGTEFGVEWTYNDTRLETLDDVVIAETNSENVWIEFHLTLERPGVWPSGTYEIAISVNGQPAVSGQVEVVEPGR